MFLNKMLLQSALVATLISLYPNFIQTATGQSICTSQQILQKDLSNCDCRGGQSQCNTQCSAGPTATDCPAMVLSQLTLEDCPSHCVSKFNQYCDACWIWFYALCSCLKNGNCQKSAANSPFWVKLGKELATTDSPIPDILTLQGVHAMLAIFGWDFGQDQTLSPPISDPNSEALVINSVHSITENQIHMHICPFNQNMRNFLSGLYQGSPSFYGVPRDIPSPYAGQKMWCQASQTVGLPISGNAVSDEINFVLQQPGVCRYYVGAAVMRDKNGYTWGCVTADHLSTEYQRFCA